MSSLSKNVDSGNALIVNIDGHLDPLLMYFRRLFVDCKPPSRCACEAIRTVLLGVGQCVSYPRVFKEGGNGRFMATGNLNDAISNDNAFRTGNIFIESVDDEE